MTTIHFATAQNKLPENANYFLKETLEDYNNAPLLLDETGTKMSKYDFSSIWLQRHDALIGFIGDNYQRFYIKFLSIIKNPTDSLFHGYMSLYTMGIRPDLFSYYLTNSYKK